MEVAGSRGYRVFATGMATNNGNQFAELTALRDKHIVDIAGGHDHAIFLSAEGRVYAMGRADLCGVDLQDQSFLDMRPVTKAIEDIKIVRIAASYRHNLLVSEDGSVFSFGAQRTNCLGLGHLQSAWVPTRITMLDGHHAVNAHADTNGSSILTDKNELFCFGTYWGDCFKVPIPQGVLVRDFGQSSSMGVMLGDNGIVYQFQKDTPPVPVALGGIFFSAISTRGAVVIGLSGYPDWSIQCHRHFPVSFRKAVKTLLLCHQRDEKQHPRHPESNIWSLPIELLHKIIAFMAPKEGRAVYTGLGYTSPTELGGTKDLEIVSIAAGYQHQMLLSASGTVYFSGDNNYGQFGTSTKAGSQDVQTSPSLSGCVAHRIFAGSYASFVLV